MKLKNIDVEKVARVVEVDAGQVLPGLRESPGAAKRGEYAASTPRKPSPHMGAAGLSEAPRQAPSRQ